MRRSTGKLAGLAVLATLLMFAVPGVALARLQLSLKISVPKHLTAKTEIPVSGEVNGEQGAEFLSIFASKTACTSSYTAEERLSGTAKVVSLLSADEQGPFSATVQLGKPAQHATYLCSYFWHTAGAASKPKTDRLTKTRL